MIPADPTSRRTHFLAAAAIVVTVALVGASAGYARATQPPPPSSAAAAPALAAPLPAEDLARGILYDGLLKAGAGSPCKGQFEMLLGTGELLCTHGPDPAPAGVDVRSPAPAPVAANEAAVALTPPCQGDGVTGPRVQLVYAHAAGVADRYSTMVASFRQWAAQVDDVFNLSAAETGGTRHIRFVHDPSCQPTVLNVSLTATGDDSLTNTITELRAQGYNRADRKYLVWADANVYCGIAQVYNDDRPTQDNPNNGRSEIPGMVARIDTGCWGSSTLVEAHELTHTLGSVQPTAPNASPNGHCTDEYDRMCYPDAQGVTMRIVCGAASHELRLDCNHDDYFSTAPPAGSWLATHWNTANSVFLAATGTPPTTVPPPTTTTTRPPVTTTTTRPPVTTTTTRPPVTTTTTRPPVTTTTTVPPATTAQTTRFVNSSYRDVVGRAPTQAETDFWLGVLGNGFSRTAMAGILTTTVEYRRLVVNNYYQAFLGRSATTAELDALVNAVADGWPLEWAATIVLGGDEYFFRAGGTVSAFVNAVWTLTVGPPDPNGVAFWVDQVLTNGLSRYVVALAFLTSGAVRQNVVTAGFSWFLDRQPSPSERTAWADGLAAGLRQEAFFASLVGSPEYWSKV